MRKPVRTLVMMFRWLRHRRYAAGGEIPNRTNQ